MWKPGEVVSLSTAPVPVPARMCGKHVTPAAAAVDQASQLATSPLGATRQQAVRAGLRRLARLARRWRSSPSASQPPPALLRAGLRPPQLPPRYAWTAPPSAAASRTVRRHCRMHGLHLNGSIHSWAAAVGLLDRAQPGRLPSSDTLN